MKTVYAEGESSGYTQEQIDAAKAWLSAHGYPPTRAGAAQAYADFDAGKLDNDPDVRRYKGLDKQSEGPAGAEGGESPGREKRYAGDETSTDDDSYRADVGGTQSEMEVAATELETDGPEVDIINIEEIMKEDVEGEIRSNPGLRLPDMENKDLYLIYDKYEKSNDKNDTAFIIIIAITVIIVMISVFFLIRSKE